MKKIAIALCVLLILGLFAGCNSQDAYVPTGDGLSDMEITEATTETALPEKQTNFTLAYDVDEGFNPYEATALSNQMVFSLVYQGLFTMTRDYEVEGVLCAAYVVSEDYCTHTFTLESATFSDGTAVTAADVVASLKAAKAGQVYSGRFALITDIAAVDEKTVRIVTSCAYENLPMLLDIPITKASQVNDATPIGSGPYEMSVHGNGYVLSACSSWWCDAKLPVNRELIELKGFESPTQIRDEFQFGNVGFSLTDPGNMGYAQYRGDYELWDVETGVFVYLVCNAASTVFSDSEVRSALTYAIDRTAIVQDCYDGFGHAAVLAASADSPFYNAALASTISYDSGRLEQMLIDKAMAGQTVTLLVNKEDSVRVRAARLIAQMLTDCGLVVEMKEYSSTQYTEALLAGNFDLYLGQTKLSASMDLTQFFVSGGSLRYGGLTDSAIYEMCKKALENSGNFYNLHQMILEDGQLVPILFRTNALYAQRGLASDLEPARDNVFFYSLGKQLTEITTIDYGA